MRYSDETEPLLEGMVKVYPIIERYTFQPEQEAYIRSLKYEFGFNGFGEAVFMRTYSRVVGNRKESFPDTVIRVVEGVMSIRKDWYIKHSIPWDQAKWDTIAVEMGRTMMNMQWLPPGRGLWACGTDYAYTRGGTALNNCGFVSTKEGLTKAVTWIMDTLMCGCGDGFDTEWSPTETEHISPPGCPHCAFEPAPQPCCASDVYVIHDSREGWVKSVNLLLKSYLDPTINTPIYFDYSAIRPMGVPIKGFGGTASGPEPLRILHNRIRAYFECYSTHPEDPETAFLKLCDRTNMEYVKPDLINLFMISRGHAPEEIIKKYFPTESEDEIKVLSTKTYGTVRLITDIINAVGACVVAGNVRRSSEICFGKPRDHEFLNLKNYVINPERGMIAHLSNNSAILEDKTDFLTIPLITRRMQHNGEPGILNRLNCQRYGRVGRFHKIGREGEVDKAIGSNPCGEISLESYEFCCLSEVFPTRCYTNNTLDLDKLTLATHMATIYASTVSLLPTHWGPSNAVITANHRIGVSLSGLAELYDHMEFTTFSEVLKGLYREVRAVNQQLAREAGVPESLRVTTVKPSGTISQLVGTSSGIHYPTFQYAIRRMRVSVLSDIVPVLKAGNYQYEPDVTDPQGTVIFSFPIKHDNVRIATDVTVREQADLVGEIQNIWSDNQVSVTLYFNPEREGRELERVISQAVPKIKSLSGMPHMAGVYPQMPYEAITEDTYNMMLQQVQPLQWAQFMEPPIGESGCTNDVCERKVG